MLNIIILTVMLVSIIHVVIDKISTAHKVLWICLIVFLPLFGSVIWWAVCSNRKKPSGEEVKNKPYDVEVLSVETASKVLGVSAYASQDEIKKAYESKIAEWHPDKLVGMASELKEMAAKKVKLLNEAKAALISSERPEPEVKGVESESLRDKVISEMTSMANETERVFLNHVEAIGGKTNTEVIALARMFGAFFPCNALGYVTKDGDQTLYSEMSRLMAKIALEKADPNFKFYEQRTTWFMNMMLVGLRNEMENGPGGTHEELKEAYMKILSMSVEKPSDINKEFESDLPLIVGGVVSAALTKWATLISELSGMHNKKV